MAASTVAAVSGLTVAGPATTVRGTRDAEAAMRGKWLAMAAAAAALLGPGPGASADKFPVDADGTIHVPAFDYPLPQSMSPEMRAWTIERLHDQTRWMLDTPNIHTEEQFVAAAKARRKLLDDSFEPRAKEA